MHESQERDESVERLLRQPMQAPEGAATDECLDAETVAAWLDDELAGEELERAQTHVADCARCQAVLATAIKVGDALPVQESAPAHRRWFRWLVPVTAAAGALVLWVAIPRESRAPAPTVSEAQDSLAKMKSAESARPPVEIDRSVAPAAPEPSVSRRAQASQPPESAARRDAAAPEVGQAAREERFAEIAPAPAPSPAAPSAAPSPEAMPSSASGALADSAPAAKAAAAAPMAAMRQRVPEQGAARLNETIASTPIVTSADRAEQWRIAGDSLQRSVDSGATWIAASLPASVAAGSLTAGAAPAGAVWLAGRSGVVVRSTDRRQFSRIPFPEAVDLTSIQAFDDRNATVTTSDGRQFRTTDAGQRWEQR